MDKLSTDKKQESYNLATANKSLESCAVPNNITPAPARDTKFANKAVDWCNYFGLGFVANSALSLFISYNVMPTEAAQNGIKKLSDGIKPVVGGWGSFKKLIGIGKEIDHATHQLHINESARSMAEIIVMCIAGTLILAPMKWVEDSKKFFVDKIDKWKNPEYHEHCEKNAISPEPLPHENDEKKTWGRMLSARFAGVASVIGIDAALQNFNNKRQAVGKGNLDTAEWKLGGFIFDKLPKKTSEKFINFFSAHKTSDLSGIQKPILERLEQTVGGNKNKMMFAEQTRLFSKEVSLTLIMSGIVYSLAKTGVVSGLLNALGIKKSDEQHKAIDDMLPDVPFVPITHGAVKLKSDDNLKSNDEPSIDYKTNHAEKIKSKGDSFIKTHLQEQNSPAYAGI